MRLFARQGLGTVVAVGFLFANLEAWTGKDPFLLLRIESNRRVATNPRHLCYHENNIGTRTAPFSSSKSVMPLAMSIRPSENDEENLNKNSPNGSNKKEHLNGNDASASNLSSSSSSVPKNITELALKKIRLAKAQAEIDRLLNCPIDPIFDAESELKKEVSISPPLIPEGSAEYALEEQISQLEDDLYQAVKQTDFVTAAERSAAISQKHIDDCGKVLQVNSKFYGAFSRKNLDEMREVWLADRSCVCIHPSHKPVVGIRDISNSWESMFGSSQGSFQRSWMEPQEIRLTVKATTAIVTCEEHVYTRRFIRGQKRQTDLVNKLQATNIFRKIGGQWYMTYHHSSWHADSDAAKQALRQQEQPSKNNARTKGRRLSPDTGIDKILGINNFGPLLGDGKEDGNSDGKPVKRVIMGSLSDILSGNLEGLLGPDGDDNSDASNSVPQNDDDMIGGGGAIIHFEKIDDDDDEEEEDVDDLEGTEMQDWAKRENKKSASRSDKKALSSSPAFSRPTRTTRESRRQDCIGALRKLANQGRISPKQKRLLLTDIISASARGELSMVEVAYELLCIESSSSKTRKDFNSEDATDSVEDAEEEFADQCIVFAQSFSGDL